MEKKNVMASQKLGKMAQYQDKNIKYSRQVTYDIGNMASNVLL